MTSGHLPAHTPYDGTSRPFTIAMRPLDPQEWIEVDDRLGAYLAQKDRHMAERPELVFVEEAGTRAAQREVLDLLTGHLTRRYPALYRAADDVIEMPRHGRAINLDEMARPPLATAALLVQEDLVLMRRDESGWRLVAASLCFPSSWSLREKFGRPLQDIHRPVPAFGAGTRNAVMIERIFDNLAVDRPTERLNWSLQDDAELYSPLSHAQRKERAGDRPLRFAAEEADAGTFLRVERQTLRKLPASGDILFTIRIHLDPMRLLARHPERARIAAAFADQLDALDEAQAGYKGLSAERARLAARLRAIAAA